MIINIEKFTEIAQQLSDVKVKGTVPDGTFTGNSDSIVKNLLSASHNDIGKAIKKLVFYKNRAGVSLKNRTAINQALKELQKRNSEG